MQQSLLDDFMIDGANRLLHALNIGRTGKDIYHGTEIYKVRESLFLIVCINRHDDLQFNVVDEFGNIPDGWCANWRNYSIVKQELKNE